MCKEVCIFTNTKTEQDEERWSSACTGTEINSEVVAAVAVRQLP